jgi:hypothetical protein
VNTLGIVDDTSLKKALLERVKVYNYVPETAGEAYAEALIREYRNYRPTGT